MVFRSLRVRVEGAGWGVAEEDIHPLWEKSCRVPAGWIVKRLDSLIIA